ncbi:uncharacterized protein LOC143043048 [Mytilus galloprovincialis]|uniref:18S rRNA (Guanine1575-N7)-methyltransferase n=1 Tax=Mytilus galloprovincialis TaxID=29158 RepID=A0A8B6BNL2_MYTGA|nr:18S rRNA (guanine1575-N7)-methyltransferase [Mytilus galloprovincialis]
MTKERFIYLLKDTQLNKVPFIGDHKFKLTKDIAKFGVRNLKGGHTRRPEVAGAKMYGEQEVTKYIANERNTAIQRDMTFYALNLLNFSSIGNRKEIFLDIGCGNGVSSQIIEAKGHMVIGVDISQSLLAHAKWNTSLNDFVQLDVSTGVNFRSEIFKYAISVSVLQWFIKEHYLLNLFRTLQFILEKNGKAVFQFYPRVVTDLDLTLSCAEKFFNGFLVSDFPSANRGVKLFLYLTNNSKVRPYDS